jgi:hypothetical protein
VKQFHKTHLGKWKISLAIFFAFSGKIVFAETRTVPVFELGAQLFAGDEGKSLRGAKAYATSFRSEVDRGRIRGIVGAQFDYSTGSASVGTDTLSYSMYGGSFIPGYSLYFFRNGYFQPFFSGAGILGWNFLSLSSPPTGTEPYTQGFSYGYELSSGVDIRFKRSGGRALRLKCSYSNVSGQIAGLSGFQLAGIKFIVGVVF